MRYNYFQQQQLKQIITEAMILRLNRAESQAYISQRFGEHVADKYIDGTKANLRRKDTNRLRHLQRSRDEFIGQVCFKRVDEVDKYIQEAWRLYLLNSHDPYLQKGLLRDLHDYTVTLANLYEAVPYITGLGSAKEEVKNASEGLTAFTQSKEKAREQAKF